MDSPAAQAASDAESSVKKIPLPTIETYEPKELSAAAAAYAVAVRKLQEAEKEIAKIKAERLERDKRIALLQNILSAVSNKIIDIWCASYTTRLDGVVRTLEVPGYWQEESVLKSATLYAETDHYKNVLYYERSINIAPEILLGGDAGDLVPSESMTDAAVFYNAAMEPGHNKWKPLWRYGVLLTDHDHHRDTNQCTVQLNDAIARELSGDESEMSINKFNDYEILTGVPIVYPPCNGVAFYKDDEVLVYFDGMNRETPVVVGFRRQPHKCPDSWAQLV